MTQALLLSTLLVLSAAPASRTPKARLQAAQAELNQGDFQGALRILDAAVETTSDAALLSRMHLLRGEAYAAMRDLPAAEGALARALEHDPEASLDPNRVDPALVTMLSGLRDRLQGTLEVTADRPNTRVSIDGKPAGTAPLRTQLGLGRHRVEGRTADGRAAGSDEVVVYHRKTARVALALKDVPGAARAPPPPSGGAPLLFGFGKPFADLRLQFDPFQWNEGLGIEVGGGLQSQFLRLGLNLRVFPQFGFNPRGAFVVPLHESTRVFIELELPVLFVGGPAPVAFALGGAGGLDFEVNRWLSVFAQLGARHFFVGVYESNRLTLQGGVRLRLP